MKDREVILRYLSFRWFDYKNKYTGDMSHYVESAMREINKMDDEKINKMKEDFEFVMTMSFEIWGKKNFRIPTSQTRGTMNTAILESVCNYLSFKDKDFIIRNKTTIKNNYNNLIQPNSSYFDAVTTSTGNKARVFKRFELAHSILDQGAL